jgi:hypothetical protein
MRELIVRVVVACLIFLFILPAPTLADIAPMSYDGFCFTPVESADIRMAREAVDIYLGDRVFEDRHVRWVRVDARFYMQNDASDTIIVDVGFPVATMWLGSDDGRPDSLRMARSLDEIAEMGIYDFCVSVGSGPTFQPEPKIVFGAYHHRIEHEHVWFGWKMFFPPGETTVDVSYHLRTNHGYARMDQHAKYVLGTGRFWKENIDDAVVRVHLPPEHEKIQLIGVWPETYTKTNNTLIWHWLQYEPEWNDAVSIGFYPPEIVAELRSLEKLERSNPEDPEIRMELAKKYLNAAYHKGPEHTSRTDFAKLAEIRLEKVLEIDSTNVEAWHLYLRNYHRMYKNCFGLMWYSQFGIHGRQRRLVERAFAVCPDDEGLQIWGLLISEPTRKPPEEVRYGIRRDRNGNEYFVLCMSAMQERGPVLRGRDLQLMDKYYRRDDNIPGEFFFRRKSGRTPDKDKIGLIRIFERRGFFRYENLDRLQAYYNR